MATNNFFFLGKTNTRFGNGRIDRDKEIGATRQRCQDTNTNIKRFGDGRIDKAWVYGLKMN